MIKRWLPMALIACAMALAFIFDLHRELSLSSLVRQRALLAGQIEANLVLSILVFALVYIVVVALSLPGGAFLTIFGGFLFGWQTGGTVTIFAATIGALCLFLAARTSLGATLAARAGPFVSRLSEGFQDNALSYLLFLRLAPIFPFWLVNIAPALLGVSVRVYLLATFFGIMPATYAFSYIGSGLGAVIAEQEVRNPGCALAGTCRFDLTTLVSPDFLAIFLALGLIALLPPVIRFFRKRRAADAADAPGAHNQKQGQPQDAAPPQDRA